MKAVHGDLLGLFKDAFSITYVI